MRLRRPRTEPVPTQLVDQVRATLTALESAQDDLALTLAAHPDRSTRRRAYAQVSDAFAAADDALRQATTLAKAGSYLTWQAWRAELAELTRRKVTHYHAERDAMVRGNGSVQALDTGMTGPANGDLLHGESSMPGAAPAYGLDLDAVLNTVSTRPAACR